MKTQRRRPYLARLEALLAIAGVVMVIELMVLLGARNFFPTSGFFAEVLPNVLTDKTNAYRRAQQLPPLTINPLLEKAATLKAADMARLDYFSHTGPDGATPWSWLKQVGYNFSAAGENLAVSFIDSQAVIDAWVASPAHRQNLLDAGFTDIGIGVARGRYQNKDSLFIVQFFAKPSAVGSAVVGILAPAPTATMHLPKQTNEITPPARVQVLGEQIVKSEEQIIYSSLAERIFTAPWRFSSFLLLTLFTLITASLILKICTGIKGHSGLLTNSLFLLVLITGAILLNRYLGSAGIIF